MADRTKGPGFWRRLAIVAAVVVVTTPMAAVLKPFGDDLSVRGHIAESLAFLIMFGWWLYLPGLVVYTIALPRLLHRSSWPPRLVAILAWPLILAVPLMAFIGLAVFGSTDPGDAPDPVPVARMLMFLLLPSLVAAAVVPLPKAEDPGILPTVMGR